MYTAFSVKQESACSVSWRLHPSANRFINSRKADSWIPSRLTRRSHPPDAITETSITRTKALPALSRQRVRNVRGIKGSRRNSAKFIIARPHSVGSVFVVSLAEASQLGSEQQLFDLRQNFFHLIPAEGTQGVALDVAE